MVPSELSLQDLIAGVLLPRSANWMLAVQQMNAPVAAQPVAFLGFGKKKDPKAEAAEKAAAEKKAKEKLEAQKAKDKAKADARAAETTLEAKRDALKKAEKELREAEKNVKATPPKEEPKPTPEPAPKPKPAPEPEPKPTTAKPRQVSASIPIEEFAKVLKRDNAKAILQNTANELIVLQQQAHPLFRPVIADYLRFLGEIADGKTKQAEAQLAALKKRRAEVLAKAKAIQDYVDWYQANHGSKWSGLFDDYLRVPQMIKDELPKRTDPMSIMLDEEEAKLAK